jgi:hypothetical protein
MFVCGINIVQKKVKSFISKACVVLWKEVEKNREVNRVSRSFAEKTKNRKN